MILKRKFIASYFNQRGFSLISLSVALALMSIVMLVSYNFLHFHTKSILHAQSFASEKEIEHFIEKFFQSNRNCKLTLQHTQNGKFGSRSYPITHIISWNKNSNAQNPPQTVESFFPQNDNKYKLRVWTDIQRLDDKKTKAIARIKHCLDEIDPVTRNPIPCPKEKEKSFYIDILMDNKGEISHCGLLNEGYCKKGHEHILLYDESSLNSIQSSPVPVEQKEGQTYRTLVETNHLKCYSYSLCSKGDWNHDMFCYNECTDRYWTKEMGLKYIDAASMLGRGRGNRPTSKHWCQPSNFSVAICRLTPNREREVKQFCTHNKQNNAGNYSSDEIKSLCEGINNLPSRSNSVNSLRFPGGNYRESITRSLESEILDNNGNKKIYAHLNVHAQCEKTGHWHILGVSCDEDPYIEQIIQNNNTAKGKNIFGRDNTDPQCSIEYPYEYCRCRTNQNIVLEPRTTLQNPMSRQDRTRNIKNDIYRGNLIGDYVACGASIRFTFDFEQQEDTVFTYYCDDFLQKFKLFSKTKYCVAENERPKLDLVFVIDNSGSMKEEQTNLINNLNNFLDLFLTDDNDLHFAVLTTNPGNRIPEGYLCNHCGGSRQKSLANLTSRLKSAIDAGIGGSGTELAFQPVENFFNRHPDFVRSSAVFGLFILTDEDDRSGSSSPSHANNFHNFLFVNGNSGSSYYNKSRSQVFLAVNDEHSKKRMDDGYYTAGTKPINGQFLITGQAPIPRPDCRNGQDPDTLRYFMTLVDRVNPINNPDNDYAHYKGTSYPNEAKSPNEVDLCDPNFGQRLSMFGEQLASLLETTAPPIRPAILNIMDHSALNKRQTGFVSCP